MVTGESPARGSPDGREQPATERTELSPGGGGVSRPRPRLWPGRGVRTELGRARLRVGAHGPHERACGPHTEAQHACMGHGPILLIRGARVQVLGCQAAP